MVSLAMGAAMMGTIYFLWARYAQHGGSASGGGLVCVSTKLQGSTSRLLAAALSGFLAESQSLETFGLSPSKYFGRKFHFFLVA